MEWFKKHKKFITIFLGLVLVLMVLDVALTPSQPAIQLNELTINGQVIKVEIATTPAEQSQGLSNRPSLAAGTGMLFNYLNEQAVVFWMKDMHFPLDIIWIKDNQVVGLEQNVSAAQVDVLPTYASPGPIDSVLEINAGEAARYNIKPGDQISTNL